MRNCFIPMCDAKCRDWTKRMMFMAPKDDAVFNLWVECIPQHRRAFRKTDRICERHFNKEDIITTWDHIINGEVHKLDRTKPKLKLDAVPTLNLDYTPSLNWLIRKGKDTQKSAKKAKLDVENQTSIVSSEVEPKPKVQIGVLNDNLVINEPAITPIENTSLPYLPANENGVEAIEEEYIPEEILQKFDSLYDDVFEVTLPNTLWGWHRDTNRKFICVSQFSAAFMMSIKMIIVFNNMITKTYILDKEIAQTELVDADPDNLSTIIEDIDKLKLCPGMLGPDRLKCMYILDPHEQQEKCIYCLPSQSKISG